MNQEITGSDARHIRGFFFMEWLVADLHVGS